MWVRRVAAMILSVFLLVSLLPGSAVTFGESMAENLEEAVDLLGEEAGAEDHKEEISEETTSEEETYEAEQTEEESDASGSEAESPREKRRR